MIVRGQSLIEVLAAVAVLSLAVTGLITLAGAGAAAADERSARLQATYLALEGIEYVRQVRDENWEAGRAWGSGIVDPLPVGGDFIVGYGLRDGRNKFYTDDVPASLDDAATDVAKTTRSANLWAQGDGAVAADSELTRFSRLITTQALCYDKSTDDETIAAPGAGCNDGSAEGVEITSAVQWIARGRTHNTELRTRLYGWQ